MYSDKQFSYADFKNDFSEEELYNDNEGEDAFLFALNFAFGGSLENMRALGDIYSMCGHGVKVNYEKSIFWYQRAVDGGDLPSALRLADILYRAEGAPKDERRAFALYKLASDNGFTVATARLAEMYLHGRGTEKDFITARRLFEISAEAGEREACFEYAHILKSEGADGWREYLKKSADQSFGKATWEYYNLLVAEGCTDIRLLKMLLIYSYYDEINLGEEERALAKVALDNLK